MKDIQAFISNHIMRNEEYLFEMCLFAYPIHQNSILIIIIETSLPGTP